tara:strand:+ start:6846 stop:8798 length:1953 start_codon:yes stop_codon:yes gene_type:complete
VTSQNLVNILVKADSSKAESSFDKVRKAVVGVSLAAAGAAAALVKIGDDITKAGRNIQATTGASGRELEALKKEFKDVASAVPQDFDTVSKSIGSVHTELGLTGNQLEKTTKQFLDLSRITGTEVGPLIKQVSDAMDLFGLDASQAGSSMDSFAKASQLTGVPISQLTSRVTEFGPVLRNLGLGMNETIALMGQLEGAGISASRVMPALNASMRRMAQSGTQDLGEGLETAMRAIKGATTDTEALNLATDLFGAEGAQRMSVAIRDGTVNIEELATTLGNATGTVEEMNDGTLTAGERWEIWTNKMKLAVGPLAELMAGIGPIVIILPSLFAGIGALAGIQAVQTAVTWLQTAAMTALNLALSPISLIILGIVVAIGAAILIWKNWDAIMETVTATLQKLDEFLTGKFGTTWIYIRNTIVNVVDAIKEVFSGLMALFSGDIDGFKEHMSNALGFLKDAFDNFIKGIWEPFDDFMTNKFGGAWETAKSLVSANIEMMKGFFNGLVEAIQGAWQIIVGIFSGDTDKIKEGFKSIVNGIIEMFNGVIRAVNEIQITMPDWLGGKEFGFNFSEIPKLAKGGIVNSPTLAMIGEAGPEAVVPLNGASGGLGGGVTVNVMMPEGGTVIMDDESTMQRFSDFITREIRQVLRTQGGF